MAQDPQPVALEPLSAAYLVRVTLRNAVPEGQLAGAPPTNAQLAGALEAALLTHFPDFTPTCRSERVDK